MVHPITWFGLMPGINELPAHTVTATFVSALLIVFAFVANRQLAQARDSGTALVPDEKLTVRNLAELLVGGVQSMSDGVLGHAGRKYLGIFGTFFIFILVSNLLGLVPGFAPPTSNTNVTWGLGAASFAVFIGAGIHAHGLVAWAKHFVGPIWWLGVLMVPLEIIDHCVRPLSLGLRLYGNMHGDHLVLEIFTDLTKFGVPVVFYGLGTFVSLIQAFVFTLLTIIYVSLAVGGHGDDHH
jgi:F-type H+-transporting ATPase subunit a